MRESALETFGNTSKTVVTNRGPQLLGSTPDPSFGGGQINSLAYVFQASSI
jgi:hypothetical protein